MADAHRGWIAIQAAARRGPSAGKPFRATRLCGLKLRQGSWPAARLRRAVRTRRPALAAGFLLERRSAIAGSILDNLQPVFELTEAPADGAWARTRLDRPAGDRRGQRLLARCRDFGDQRRSPWRSSRIPLTPPSLNVHCQRMQEPHRAQAVAGRSFSPERAGSDAPRGRSPSTASAFPTTRRGRPARRAMRRYPPPAMAVSSISSLPYIQPGYRQALAGAGRHQRHCPISGSGGEFGSPLARSSPAAAPTNGCRTTTSPRWRPTWYGAA